jgi:hypothetical protein
METTKQETIGALVTKDYRLATVFESFGIDFCCKGNRSIEEACEKLNIESETVWTAVNNMLNTSNDGARDFDICLWTFWRIILRTNTTAMWKSGFPYFSNTWISFAKSMVKTPGIVQNHRIVPSKRRGFDGSHEKGRVHFVSLCKENDSGT